MTQARGHVIIDLTICLLLASLALIPRRYLYLPSTGTFLFLTISRSAGYSSSKYPVYIHTRLTKYCAKTAAWRVPIGESGVLEFFLGLAQSSGCHVVQMLRVIGNACVDCSKFSLLRLLGFYLHNRCDRAGWMLFTLLLADGILLFHVYYCTNTDVSTFHRRKPGDRCRVRPAPNHRRSSQRRQTCWTSFTSRFQHLCRQRYVIYSSFCFQQSPPARHI